MTRTFTFTDEEMLMLESWYQSAAGESATSRQTDPEWVRADCIAEHKEDNKKLAAFLDKLGFESHHLDEEELREFRK